MSPENIDPVAVSSAEYEQMTCQELTSELTRTSAALSKESDDQDDRVALALVALVLVAPPSEGYLGEPAKRIARLKGERIAISTTMKTKRCYGVGEPELSERADVAAGATEAVPPTAGKAAGEAPPTVAPR